MTKTSLKEICTEIYRAVNAGQVERALEHFREEAFLIEPFVSRMQIKEVTPGTAQDPAGARGLMADFLRVIHRQNMRIDMESLHLWAEDSTVGAEYRMTMDSPRGAGAFSDVFVDVWEFEDGKVQELRHYPDTLAFHVEYDIPSDRRWVFDQQAIDRRLPTKPTPSD